MSKYSSIPFVRVSILDMMGVNKEKEHNSTVFSFASYIGQQFVFLNYSPNQ